MTLENSEKQHFLQDVIDNSSAVIFAKRPDGRYIFINKEFEKLYKVSKEKVINMTDYEIFPKEFADLFVAKDKLILEADKPFTYEEKIPLEDSLHTYVIVKFPLHDSAGKLYAVCGIATDITARKRVEEALKSNENRFNYVLAATQDAIYDWDIETGRIWRNEQYEKTFDGPSGPNSEWWKTHIHPDEFKDVLARLEATFKKHEQLWNQEYRFKRADGGYAYVIDRGFIIYNSEGKPTRMIGAFMDITERKQILDDLERSLSLLRATLESTTDGIMVTNWEEKIKDYNKKFAEIWRIPDSILETKDDKQTLAFILSQLKDPNQFTAKVKDINAAPEVESFDVLELLDGRTFERYSRAQRTKERIVGRVWSFRDITLRKKTQEAEKIKIYQMLIRQQELLKLTGLKTELPLEEKFKVILESDAKALMVERVSICFFDATESILSSSNTYSLSKNSYMQGVSFHRNDYPRYFQELKARHVIDANDAMEDPRTSELYENYLKPLGIVSVMSTPIRSSEKVIGVILHEHITQKRIWSYEEQAFAYSVADIITLAIENENKKKISNDLIESEQRFRFAISQLPVLFAVFDKELRWTMAGGKILDSLGLKPPTLIGKTLFQTSDTIDINISNHKAALEGKSSIYEYKLGETFLQRFIEPLQDTTGKIVGVISMSLDITERKKAELEIKKLNNKLEQYVKERTVQLAVSENLFQVLVENIKEYCIIMLDTQGNIISWNQGAQRIYGYAADEIIGKHISVIYTEEEITNDVPANNLKIAKEKGHIENTGWRLRKDGSKFWADTIITVLYEDNRNLKGFAKITHDISERRKVEESLMNKQNK